MEKCASGKNMEYGIWKRYLECGSGKNMEYGIWKNMTLAKKPWLVLTFHIHTVSRFLKKFHKRCRKIQIWQIYAIWKNILNMDLEKLWIWIQFVLRGWIRIRAISDRIRNPAFTFATTLAVSSYFNNNCAGQRPRTEKYVATRA